MTLPAAALPPALHDTDRISLCEALDRVLNKGAVVLGELTISIADVDLVYVGLQVVLTSIETARGCEGRSFTGQPHGVALGAACDELR